MTPSEQAIKSDLLAATESDFDFREEVKGRYLVDGSGVRVDLMLRPKVHLVSRGFDDQWFAVEIKDIDFAVSQSKALYWLFWQSITYGQSVFSVDLAEVRPSFVIMCIRNRPPNYSSSPEMAQRRRWDILTELGVYANVGYFKLVSPDHWQICFGQGLYFDKIKGQTKVPRGLGRRAGNSGSPRGGND